MRVAAAPCLSVPPLLWGEARRTGRGGEDPRALVVTGQADTWVEGSENDKSLLITRSSQVDDEDDDDDEDNDTDSDDDDDDTGDKDDEEEEASGLCRPSPTVTCAPVPPQS